MRAHHSALRVGLAIPDAEIDAPMTERFDRIADFVYRLARLDPRTDDMTVARQLMLLLHGSAFRGL